MSQLPRIAICTIVTAGATSCGTMWRGPSISGKGGVQVVAPKDAGKPATIDQHESTRTWDIPANAKITVAKADATPATQTAQAIPAKESFTSEAPEPLHMVETLATTQASTGTIDTSVAQKRIDAGESRPLLYAAIGAAILAIAAVAMKWPSAAVMLGGASATFFAAWKLSGLPEWFWMCGVVLLGAAGALWLGYKRGFEDKDGDGVPDALQRRKSK